MQLYTLPVYSFDTNKGTLVLTCVNWREPNNGRMLYEVQLTLNGEDVTEYYFGKWNYINCCGEYKPLSAGKSWIYIPKEGDHFLINAQTLAKTDLPPVSLSAVHFIKNVFYDRFLVVLNTDILICKDLLNGSVKILQADDKNRFKDITHINHEVVCVSTANGGTREFKFAE